MFLGAYHFDGESSTLLDAYDRLRASMPPDILMLHVCVARDGGITVFDACPSRAVFHDFSTGEEFRGACDAAGLPQARVEQLGEVHDVVLRPST